MAYRYKKITIKNNALVKKGAMGVKPILKEDGSYLKVDNQIFKANDEKQELTTTLVIFNKYDSQDMILDDEDVRDEAMIDFVANGNKTLKILHASDEDDDSAYIEAPLKEIYVVKENDKDFSVGSINATYKVRKQEDWSIIKSLELQTSIEGEAELEVVKEDIVKEGTLKEFVTKFKAYFITLFGKDKVEEMLNKEEDKEEEMTKEELEVVLQNICKNESNDFVVSVVKEVVNNVDNEFAGKEEVLGLIKSVTSQEVADLKLAKEEIEQSKQVLEQEIAELKELLKQQQTPSGDRITPINPKNVSVI